MSTKLKKELKRTNVKLPSRITIAGHDFQIKEDSVRLRASNCYGECNTHSQIISLDTTASRTMISETLLHEVLHAIYYHQGLQSAPQIDEELAVNNLSSGLFTCLKNNPKLVEFIMEK